MLNLTRPLLRLRSQCIVPSASDSEGPNYSFRLPRIVGQWQCYRTCISWSTDVCFVIREQLTLPLSSVFDHVALRASKHFSRHNARSNEIFYRIERSIKRRTTLIMRCWPAMPICATIRVVRFWMCLLFSYPISFMLTKPYRKLQDH